MGEQSVNTVEDKEHRKLFLAQLLNDVKSLEQMLDGDMFEKDVQRIGAEQEFCLMDSTFRPAPISIEFLEKANDPHFTTELARFNAEINLDPQVFSKDGLRKMHHQLETLVAHSSKVAASLDSKIILTGILPTIRKSDLGDENMTPVPRYQALSQTMARMRGEDFYFNIQGTEQFINKHQSILFEACNTSFQIHLQIVPEDFQALYNWSIATAGPVLASAVNSPLLLGKNLWKETRIALFNQAADLRNGNATMREQIPRVLIGYDWVKGSIVDLFREDISRHKVLLSTVEGENSQQALAEGKVPKLKALMMHNGTIYKWFRPCYGISDGKPHLRIENRIIPAGPTVLDEMANVAFWTGLIKGIPNAYRNIHEKMDFDTARENFFKGAKMGMDAQFKWINGKMMPADKLIIKELIPIAESGLKAANIDPKDIKKYLSVIENRVKKHKTGAQWIINSFNSLKKEGTKEGALITTTAAMYNRQESGKPVHLWEDARKEEGGKWMISYLRVEQLMTTDLITIQENDTVSLATNIMTWKKIRHIPVENEKNELVGLITARHLIDFLANHRDEKPDEVLIEDVMVKNPISVDPLTLTYDALHIMRNNKIGCLPVTVNKVLAGIITENDLLDFSMHLFEEFKESLDDKRKSDKG